MALLPLLRDELIDLWRPSRIWDQGLCLEVNDDDLLSPFIQRRLRRAISSDPYTKLARRHRDREDSQVSIDKNKFQVNLDVQQFAPNEISVKATGEDTLTVEGKHEEKQDEHGYISRHFVRKYKVPKGHDLSKCVSKLSSDGVLTITAPKVVKEGTEIEIPITVMNQPSRILDKTVANEGVENGVCCNDEEKGNVKKTDKKSKK